MRIVINVPERPFGTLEILVHSQPASSVPDRACSCITL